MSGLKFKLNPLMKNNQEQLLQFIGHSSNMKMMLDFFTSQKWHLNEEPIKNPKQLNMLKKLINLQLLQIANHSSQSCYVSYKPNSVLQKYSIELSELIFSKQFKNIVLGLPYAIACVNTLSPALGPAEFIHNFNQLSWTNTHVLGDLIYDIYNDTDYCLTERIKYLLHLVGMNHNRLIFIGGEHTLTFYTLSALRQLNPKSSLNIIHIDAHHDQYFDSHGINRLNHANFMQYVIDNLQPNLVLQFGQRDYSTAAGTKHDVTPIIHAKSINQLISIINKANTKDSLWYLTIDIDVLDPTVASSVVAPIPSGLTIATTKQVLNAIFSHCAIFYMDIMEICNDTHEFNGSAAAAADILQLIDQRHTE